MNKVEWYERVLWPGISLVVRPDFAHDAVTRVGGWVQSSPKRLDLFGKMARVKFAPITSERLKTSVGEVELDNPLILAAGFDKDARAINTLARLGFGSIVAGTVLKHPQTGNPKPRIFRPAKGVILNRMGFPSLGMETVSLNLHNYGTLPLPLGVSVGLNKDTDHRKAARAYGEVVQSLYPFAAYFEINVSSPNTPGLRELQNRETLEEIVAAIKETMVALGRLKPIFVKIAPDLTDEAIGDVLDVISGHDLAGVIAANTTTDPLIKAALGARWEAEAGGVSGTPLHERTTEIVRFIHRETAGKMDIIASGGISDLDSALEKFSAGAKALQVYSALIYRGPSLPSLLLRQLDGWLEARGVDCINDIIGDEAVLK